MNSQVKVEPIDSFADARGLVVEPILEEHIAAQHNIHIVLTEPGGIRGNHYHEVGTEVFAVIGPALIRLREGGLLRDIHVAEGKALRLTIPPQVSHAMQNSGLRPMLLMCFNTVPHDRDHPDTVRDVLITA